MGAARALPVVYSQRDARWGGVRLGYEGGPADSTVHNYGCYVTCFAMVATYHGHAVTPGELNELLVRRQLFLRSNLVGDHTLGLAVPALAYVASLEYRDRAADLGRLAELLGDAANSVILEVDFNHNPVDGVHFVVAVGCDGERVVVADPWFGTVGDLATHYGPDPASVIQKLVVYRGPVTAADGAATAGVAAAMEEEMTAGQRAILEKMAGLNAGAESIDGWLSRIGRAAEIGRELQGTKRMPKVVRPLTTELARMAE